MPCKQKPCAKTVRSKHKRVPPHDAKRCLGRIMRGPGGTYRSVRRVSSNGRVSYRWERFKTPTGKTGCNRKNFIACKKPCKWRSSTKRRRGYCTSAKRAKKKRSDDTYASIKFVDWEDEKVEELELADYVDNLAAQQKKAREELAKQRRRVKKAARAAAAAVRKAKATKARRRAVLASTYASAEAAGRAAAAGAAVRAARARKANKRRSRPSRPIASRTRSALRPVAARTRSKRKKRKKF